MNAPGNPHGHGEVGVTANGWMPRLAVSSRASARATAVAFGATHMVSAVEAGAPLERPSSIPAGRHLILPVADTLDIAASAAPRREHLAALLEFGRGLRPGDRVLLHCEAGLSRSAACALVLLAQALDAPGAPGRGALAEAVAELYAIRPQANPNLLVLILAAELLNWPELALVPLSANAPCTIDRLVTQQQVAGLPFSLAIASLDELASVAAEVDATHVVSLLEERPPRPTFVSEANHLWLAFADTSKSDAPLAPTADHVAALIAFARCFSPNDRVLFHCQAGLSRSPACALVALAAIGGRDGLTAASEAVRLARPEAAPNSLVVSLAAELLGWPELVDAATSVNPWGFDPSLEDEGRSLIVRQKDTGDQA